MLRTYTLSLFIVSMFIFMSPTGAYAQCLTSSLNISTGFDPASGTVVTPSNTQIDPAWISTVSADAADSIVSRGDIIGHYDALPCGSWPAPLPGTTWLMGQNDWGYNTTGAGGFVFTDTFSRPFTICGTDSVSLVIHGIKSDDGIMEIRLDGSVIYSYASPSGGVSTYPAVTYNLGSLSGTHAVSFVIFNFNNGFYKNAIGIDVSANIVSNTGTPSLVKVGSACPSGATAAKDTTLCPGTPLTLSASVGGHHLWSTTDTTSSIIVSSGGAYWVKTMIDSCNFKTDTFHVNAAAIAVNLGNDTAICAGGSITLSPAVPPGATLTWSTGATGSSITVNTPGNYWVSIAMGSCVAADTIRLAVNPIPAVDLGPDQLVCAGTVVTLRASGTYGSPGYLWSTGATGASITPTVSGNYWLAVTVASCTGTDTVGVIFKPTPVIHLSRDTVICGGQVLTLSSSQPVGATFLWSTGSTDSAIHVSTTGTYSLTVDLNGCKTTATVSVTEGSVDGVKLGADTSLCFGESIVLNANNDGAVWSNNHFGPSITVTYPGTYWVTVPQQCGISSDTIKVDFHRCDLGFPTAFTPNGDGLNDVIGVVGTLQYYSNYSLSIYNRWGQRVFYTEDIYSGWDGTYNGVMQDLDTYFYMIFYTFEGRRHMMKGDFQLIR